MADRFAARQCAKYTVISLSPDWCKTPHRKGKPLPYIISIDLSGDVLRVWNSGDLDEVDRWIYLLAENHLGLATQSEEFTPITSWLFPYEIPAWLAVRKKQGVENPAEYSHPLMQQPLAEFISDTPLDKPGIPQVETLLQIVRNTLPAEAAFIDLAQTPANHE